MQNRAILGDVDVHAIEHGLRSFADAALLGKCQQ